MTLRDAKLTAIIMLVILAGLISSFFQPSPVVAPVLANHSTTRAVALWTGQEFVPYLETTVKY